MAPKTAFFFSLASNHNSYYDTYDTILVSITIKRR